CLSWPSFAALGRPWNSQRWNTYSTRLKHNSPATIIATATSTPPLFTHKPAPIRIRLTLVSETSPAFAFARVVARRASQPGDAGASMDSAPVGDDSGLVMQGFLARAVMVRRSWIHQRS